MSVEGFDLSADGRSLIYSAARPGKSNHELRSHSLESGAEALLGEAMQYFTPRLSRDGSLVAYRIIRQLNPPTRRLCWMAIAGGEEHCLPQGIVNAWDWSPDGAGILHNCPPPGSFASLCSSRREASTTANTQTIVADPDQRVWQGRYSPDGRWILFIAQSTKVAGVAVLGVVRATGGTWTPLTDATLWTDKARWGPDGRTIYFISNRSSAFFDVWGIAFDPDTGRPIGEEFRVTRYDSPARTVAGAGGSELGVGRSRLVVPIVEAKGSVWLLDKVLRPE
jgi:hypothetical protein